MSLLSLAGGRNFTGVGVVTVAAGPPLSTTKDSVAIGPVVRLHQAICEATTRFRSVARPFAVDLLIRLSSQQDAPSRLGAVPQSKLVEGLDVA